MNHNSPSGTHVFRPSAPKIQSKAAPEESTLAKAKGRRRRHKSLPSVPNRLIAVLVLVAVPLPLVVVVVAVVAVVVVVLAANLIKIKILRKKKRG